MRAHKHKRKARSERKAEFRRQYKEELEKKKRKIEGEKKRKKIVKKKKEASPEGSNEHSSSSVATAAGKKAKIKEEIAIREEKRKKKSKKNRRKQRVKRVAGKTGLAAKKIMKKGATGLMTGTVASRMLEEDLNEMAAKAGKAGILIYGNGIRKTINAVLHALFSMAASFISTAFMIMLPVFLIFMLLTVFMIYIIFLSPFSSFFGM